MTESHIVDLTFDEAELTRARYVYAHKLIASLLRAQGIEPTPAAIVEVLNCGPMPPITKLAIATAAA